MVAPGWPLGAPDSLCTVLLASPIRAGGSKRGVGPESLGVGHRDPRGRQTTLCTVPSAPWAYQTRCVQCPVAPGWSLGARDQLCTILLASPIGAGGCKRVVGPDSEGGRPLDPSGYQTTLCAVPRLSWVYKTRGASNQAENHTRIRSVVPVFFLCQLHHLPIKEFASHLRPQIIVIFALL